ncbi:hypothetical protein [Nocardioides hungaricus]
MSPRRLLLGLFGAGVALLAVGAAVFFAFFPHQESGGWFAYGDVEGGLPRAEGSLRAALVGAAIAGTGFLVVLVPIVAWGVRLGRRLDAQG